MMLKVSAMSNYQAFRWLWRFDPEGRKFWLISFLFTRSELKEDVFINLRDFK